MYQQRTPLFALMEAHQRLLTRLLAWYWLWHRCFFWLWFVTTFLVTIDHAHRLRHHYQQESDPAYLVVYGFLATGSVTLLVCIVFNFSAFLHMNEGAALTQLADRVLEQDPSDNPTGPRPSDLKSQGWVRATFTHREALIRRLPRILRGCDRAAGGEVALLPPPPAHRGQQPSHPQPPAEVPPPPPSSSDGGDPLLQDPALAALAFQRRLSQNMCDGSGEQPPLRRYSEQFRLEQQQASRPALQQQDSATPR